MRVFAYILSFLYRRLHLIFGNIVNNSNFFQDFRSIIRFIILWNLSIHKTYPWFNQKTSYILHFMKEWKDKNWKATFEVCVVSTTKSGKNNVKGDLLRKHFVEKPSMCACQTSTWETVFDFISFNYFLFWIFNLNKTINLHTTKISRFNV